MSEKPKRQLSPEQLEKLKVARAKALEVRQKKALINKAEKLEKQKEMHEKYQQIVGNKPDDVAELRKETPPPSDAPRKTTQPEHIEEPHKKETKKKKVKKILEPASDESSSDSSSDEEYDASPIKHKYKQKYKNKYQAKYATPQQHNPYITSPYQDAYMIAKHSLQSKLHNELQKTAFNSLFG